MINTDTINKFAEKLADTIPDGFQTLKGDFHSNLKAVLESGLKQMNLVSREEFDVQTALLERTQEKLIQLEAQLQELEKRI